MGLGVQQRWDSEHVSKKSCLIDIHNVEGEIYTQKNDFHTIHLQLIIITQLIMLQNYTLPPSTGG